jgi:GntR family transcriptional regulator
MPPKRTETKQPIALRIADDLRIQIETGSLRAGDPLPTLHDLSTTYGCSSTSARAAVGLLKNQGLVIGGRGKAPVVRPTPRRTELSNLWHQIEKNLVLESEEVRRRRGLAEDLLDEELDRIEVTAELTVVSADADLANTFGVPEGTALLRREFTHKDKRTGALEAWSLSWLPHDLVIKNPDISNPANVKWPGGTQHQLYTVGVEVDHFVDHVTAAMPTTVEVQAWNLAEGTPLLWVRRISVDTTDRVVEVSDAQYPSDRTMLTFHTPLTRWDQT